MAPVPHFSVGLVSISDDVIGRVARRTERPVEEVYSYLKTDRQDDELLRAFLFYGVGPFNKRFEGTK